jgi:hypothetical protein
MYTSVRKGPTVLYSTVQYPGSASTTVLYAKLPWNHHLEHEATVKLRCLQPVFS